MIFNQLTVTNFGVYRGSNVFHLCPQMSDAPRPVVLIVGQNGAGKTTLLEAVRLCLYGRLALGTRVRRVDYETFIRQRFHRAAQTVEKPVASIGLVFEHVHAGVRSTYDAVRSWHLEGEQVQERVSLFKDGQVLQEIAEEHWNDFLRDLIPPGVADLFFFDGEKIQALADERTSSDALETAVRGLLNLNLVEQLQSDLGVYLRQQERKNHTQMTLALQQARQARDEAAERCHEYHQDIASLQSRLDRTLDQLSQARQALLQEGVVFLQQRDDLEQRRKEVTQQLQEHYAAIRELAAGLLPFAVAPDWCAKVSERLQVEASSEQVRVAWETRQSLASEVAVLLLDADFQQRVAPQLSRQQWAELATAVQQRVQPVDAPAALQIRHPLVAQERERLLRWMQIATEQVPQELRTLTRAITELETEQSSLEQSLRQVPDEQVAQPLLERFHARAQEKGKLQEQMARLRQEKHQHELYLAEAERRLKQAERQLAEADKLDQRVTMAAKVQQVMDAYLQEIKTIKLQQLEHATAEFFNRLCRKPLLVKEVVIDPQAYTVTLFGRNREPLRTSELSAGEKQLYALALLWALRSVSGRAFPIIMDTPMARLDSAHRSALLTRFFPQAAHQVVLLATDTEMDAAALQMLQPAISHRYDLVYDHEQQCTVMENAECRMQNAAGQG